MEILQSEIKSEGIAFGTAFVVENDEIRKQAPALIGEEGQAKFKEAMAKVEKDLTKAAEKNEVFAAHLVMLHDPMLAENVIENIKDGADVNSAIRIAEGRITYMFGDIDDDYLKSRLDDVKDVINRLMAFIDGRDQINPYDNLPDGSIIVAHNLAPSDTAKMDIGKVVGFVTDLGSLTTHVGIFARYNGITAVVGITKCEKKIKNGDELILDGDKGLVIVNPDDQTLMEYRRAAKLEEEDNNLQLPNSPLIYEGRTIHVFGNAGNLNEVRNVIMAGADGVGLF
jgi:phosphotransferase system enzyme I (PtsI)